CS
ncbi:Glycerol-3-phosphate acyltransferase, partial [Haemophilus influenzae]